MVAVQAGVEFSTQARLALSFHSCIDLPDAGFSHVHHHACFRFLGGQRNNQQELGTQDIVPPFSEGAITKESLYES